jgi:hypothetical protein
VSLSIETHHDERTVVLRCESCSVAVPILTVDADFAGKVQGFFDVHADCRRSVDLTS